MVNGSPECDCAKTRPKSGVAVLIVNYRLGFGVNTRVWPSGGIFGETQRVTVEDLAEMIRQHDATHLQEIEELRAELTSHLKPG